jgi:hypothetical protein
MWLLLLTLLVVAQGSVGAETQLNAVENMIARIVPDHVHLFHLEILLNETLEIWELESISSDKIAIRGECCRSFGDFFLFFPSFFFSKTPRNQRRGLGIGF